MNTIRKDDNVIVITGKDKGKIGKILRILDKDRVLVEGVNIKKKHVRGNPQLNRESEIKSIEGAIHRSNVMVYNPSTKKGDRVRIKTLEDGRRVRVYASSNEDVDI